LRTPSCTQARPYFIVNNGNNISVYSPTGKITAESITPDENDDDCTKEFLEK
jgi:hypothetical protein